MPLSKVQLMDPPGGPGVIGAVRAGTGISISADGTISLVGSGYVTSVDVSGGSTGLTFAGGPITTSGVITMGGVLSIANGGTGATSLTGLQTNVFPSQGGQAGNFLTTNGSVISWSSVVTSVTGSNGITTSGSSGAVTFNFDVAALPALP